MAEIKISKELTKLINDYKVQTGTDNIYNKEVIKSLLTSNQYIYEILSKINSDKISNGDTESLVGSCVIPYYLVPEAQTSPHAYICFETGFTEVARYNDTIKLGQIIFYILCDQKIATIQGAAVHDLLAAVISDDIRYSNYFGTQMKPVSDQARPVDNRYIARTLIFEQMTPNSIVKNGVVINRDR